MSHQRCRHEGDTGDLISTFSVQTWHDLAARGGRMPFNAAALETLCDQILRDRARAEQAEAVAAGLRAALETIRRDYGRVCAEYELCHHESCASSVGAWMEADQALSRHAGQEGEG